MVLEKITEAGKQISGFSELPNTAQIALLQEHIEAARSLHIPLKAITKALNEAGSNVTLRYLRQALWVVRSRSETVPTHAPSPALREKGSSRKQSKAQADEKRLPGETQKDARERKASVYVDSPDTNPLVNLSQRQQRKLETPK